MIFSPPRKASPRQTERWQAACESLINRDTYAAAAGLRLIPAWLQHRSHWRIAPDESPAVHQQRGPGCVHASRTMIFAASYGAVKDGRSLPVSGLAARPHFFFGGMFCLIGSAVGREKSSGEGSFTSTIGSLG